MKKRLLALLLAAGMVLSSAVYVGAAEETPEEMKTRIETLESEKAELESEIENLTTQVETLTKENEELKAQLEGENETESEVKTETVGTVYTDVATTKVVQEALKADGFNCGTPDGIAGAKTTEAINAFEKEKGINVNGVITDELLDALGIEDEVKAAAEKEAAKANYSSDYTYEQLARNPDAYEGNLVKFKGEVLQAETSSGINYLRLAINSDYDTVLFVTYDSSVINYRLLEDDVVTVYGESQGVYSYEAVSGATITIPWVNADIIEMQ